MSSSIPLDIVARLRGVRHSYDRGVVLSGVDLDLRGGEVMVIAGSNGAGKTTLLEIVAGVLKPTGGVREATASIAFVPQRSAVPDAVPVTARDIATLGAWGRPNAWGRMTPTLRDDVERALADMGMAEQARRPFSSLSGGQRQRALLAQALVRRARMVLLDEPTTGLDSASAAYVRGAMRAEATRGAAVVCVSHDESVIGEADRVLRLSDGRVSDVLDVRRPHAAANASGPFSQESTSAVERRCTTVSPG